MNKGKKTCDLLKEIRKNVATKIDLDLNQTECNYKGNCSGTCPKCEKELEEINKNLDHKKLLSIVGTLGIATTLVGCSANNPNDNNAGFIEEPSLEFQESENHITEEEINNNDIKVSDTTEEYVFSEEEVENEEIKNIDELEVSDEVKNMLKKNFNKTQLRGVINPNVRLR